MPALERSSTYRQLRLPNATSRAGQMAFVRQIIQRNCSWRLPELRAAAEPERLTLQTRPDADGQRVHLLRERRHERVAAERRARGLPQAQRRHVLARVVR